MSENMYAKGTINNPSELPSPIMPSIIDETVAPKEGITTAITTNIPIQNQSEFSGRSKPKRDTSLSSLHLQEKGNEKKNTENTGSHHVSCHGEPAHHNGPNVQMGESIKATPPKEQNKKECIQNNSTHDASSTRQLKVEDALAYLDKVKTQFINNPSVYNKFLEIMKNFKAQTIDTPGVIQRVSDLFQGHDNLILGFNTFLPPGFKIEVSKPNTNIHRGKQPENKIVKAKRLTHKRKERRATPSSTTDSSISARSRGQPIEFDHAIKFVTKIKQRFCHDAVTYKKFLDILHTYQNEQNTIKEVLNDVSVLFRNHTDLLNEFTYFLPDNVREKAKNEISKMSKKNKIKLTKSNISGISKRKSLPAVIDTQIPAMEKMLFTRIRSALSSPHLYIEFLKCINLYSQQVLSRSEMISLLCDLLGNSHILLEEFDRLLASRGATNNILEDAWFSMPTSEIDFSECRRCTPSYRSLPNMYPKPPCSERTAACRSVLNDHWVSVPTGSEDFNFKNMRKNEHEERLFKCEDDRYEIDIIIDCNKSTVRVLQYLKNQLDNMTSNFASKIQIDKRTLSVIHLKSIARIYGQHGMESA